MKKLLLITIALLLAIPLLAKPQQVHKPSRVRRASATSTTTSPYNVLSWTASTTLPASNIGYNIYRGLTSGSEVIISPLTSPNGVTCTTTSPFICTYTDAGSTSSPLAPGTLYYYYVKAIDMTTKILSGQSNEITLTTTTPAVPPASPTNLNGAAH